MSPVILRQTVPALVAAIVLGSLTAGCSIRRGNMPQDDLGLAFAAEQRFQADLSRVVEAAVKGGWNNTLSELLQLDTDDTTTRHVLSQLSGESYGLWLEHFLIDVVSQTYVLCFVETDIPGSLSRPCVFCVVVLIKSWDETGIKGLRLASVSFRRWRCFDSAFISTIDVVHEAESMRLLVRLDALSPQGELLTSPTAREVALIFDYDEKNRCFEHTSIMVDGRERPRDQLPPMYRLPEDTFMTSCGDDES